MKRTIVLLAALLVLLTVGQTQAVTTFETVGVYDEQVVQTNAVNFSMAYSDSTTYTTGIGQILGSDQILTVEEFKPLVAEAFDAARGGVINFDNATMNEGSPSFVAAFPGGKQFRLLASGGSHGGHNYSTGVHNTATGGARTPISGNRRMQGTHPSYRFTFSDFGGMSPEQIIGVGVTILGRNDAGWAGGASWRVVAYYTNGTDSGSSSTQRAIPGNNGNTTQDSFSGIMAPEGYWITEVRVKSENGVWSAIDDLAFIFGDPTSANTPTPPSGAIGVGEIYDEQSASVLLQWKPGNNPDNPDEPYPPIRTYYLYMSGDQALSSDPNLFYLDQIAAGELIGDDFVIDEESAYGPLLLNLDGAYLWRVDTGVALDGGVSGPDDPNTITGPVWSFEVLKRVPVILAQPVSTIVFNNADAEFSVEAQSLSPVMFQWYRSDEMPVYDQQTKSMSPAGVPVGTQGGPIFITPADITLAIDNVQAGDQGYYYCKLWNDAGVDDAVYTDVVTLGVERLVAHWTLDEDKFVDGRYLDETGTYPADPNGVPTFVDGIIADAVAIDAGNGWATAGRWDPSRFTNTFTVSAWVKWDGSADSMKGIVSKRDIWGTNSMRWSVVIRDDSPGTVRFYNNSGLSVWPQGAGNTLPVGEWVFVTATYDGATGRVYINGTERGSDAGNLGGGTDSMIMLGAVDYDNPSGIGPLAGGTLDDVRIYNYTLDEFGVADLYYEASGENACLLPYNSRLDVSGPDGESDCRVDLYDFAAFAEVWLECGLYPDCD